MRIKAETAKDLPTKKVLVSYVKQARKLDQSTKVAAHKCPGKKAPAKEPKWMLDAISRKKKAKEYWASLTPGYKREYIEWVTEAKREATRDKRLEQTVQWLAERKTRNWKYKNC